MFDFFKKSTDYLQPSNAEEHQIMSEDKLSNYNELLNEEEVPEYFKSVIRLFLIPNKISPLKFQINMECFEDFYSRGSDNVAPSLIKFKQHGLDRPMGYPDWFYIAFPDVALWAIHGGGIELVEKKLQNYSEEEIFDGDHLNISILIGIIRMYLNNTSKSLECKKY